MSDPDKRDHNPLDDPQRMDDEPVHLPSQAEGPEDGDEDDTSLHLRTGGQAEGTEEAVEDQLRRQERKQRQDRG